MKYEENNSGNEVAKCRKRLIKYCQGVGLDLGCGSHKITPTAIGIDFDPGAREANLFLDLSDPHSLDIFADESMDYIFSSHLLEDFKNTNDVLYSWGRLIKEGGYMVLYLPHGDLYPKVGTRGANRNHKVNLYPADVTAKLKSDGFKIVRNKTYDRYERWIVNEYSFEIVAKKLRRDL